MSTQLLLIAPIVVPLVAVAVAAMARHRRGLQRGASAVALLGVVAAGVELTIRTADGVVHTVIGGEEALVGVALTAEPLGAALVAAIGILAAVSTTTAGLTGADDDPVFHLLVLVVVAGACGSFLTGDLFNLFVFFEVLLIASYVLLIRPGRARQLRAAAVYVGVNIVGTLLLLAGIAAVYGATGTVNVAELAGISPVDAGALPGAALVVVAFAVKAGLLPFSGWLVVGYPTAERTTMALFAGTLTTVGIAAVYRIVLLAFGGATVLRVGVLVAAVATVVLAALAAVAASDQGRVLALVIVTQVAFMALGFGIGTAAGVAAGVFFILQDTVVKTAAVLAYTSRVGGTATVGAARSVATASFAVLALSLAGVPPFSGFVGKALIVEAALRAGVVVAAAAAIVGSAGTLAALLPLWRRVLSPPGGSDGETRGTESEPPARDRVGGRSADLVPVALVAVAALAVGIAPGWLLTVADGAATILLDPAAYAEEVLGP